MDEAGACRRAPASPLVMFRVAKSAASRRCRPLLAARHDDDLAVDAEAALGRFEDLHK
jgi:hypothetical protein